MQKRRAGRKKFNETRHPIYKGVRERNGKWVCELRQPNNKHRVWLGTFSNPDKAAIAYDVAALAFKGDAASLNFPHAANSLPRLDSRTSSIRSIQLAAMKAAEKHFSSGDFQFQPSTDQETAMRNGSSESEYSSSSSLDCDLADGCSNGKSSSSEDSGSSLYWDEEEVFNMPGLINSMAEGLMITPPALQRGFNWVGDGETTVDLTLWEHWSNPTE